MAAEYLRVGVWTLIALGGALFLGTAAALVQHHRSGAPPGAASGRTEAFSRRRALVRCGVGLLIVVVGAALLGSGVA